MRAASIFLESKGDSPGDDDAHALKIRQQETGCRVESCRPYLEN